MLLLASDGRRPFTLMHPVLVKLNTGQTKWVMPIHGGQVLRISCRIYHIPEARVYAMRMCIVSTADDFLTALPSATVPMLALPQAVGRWPVLA